ncbi:MAG TPA: hypothetical protein VFF52_29865 [Isosphaeraceae bacterium]|nr:hypothetical protein [Isosphaeraceae bacterium]
MAATTEMIPEIRRITQAIRRYAESVHWSPNDYRIFVRPNWDWGRINIILAAREFPDGPEDPRPSIRSFLERDLKDAPELFRAIGLTVSTFEQIRRGGLHGIPEAYEELPQPLGPGPAA